jgi:hypothetical protein
MAQERSKLSTDEDDTTTTNEFVQWSDLEWEPITHNPHYWQQVKGPKPLLEHVYIYRAVRGDCATNHRNVGSIPKGDICIMRKDTTETLYDGHVLGAMAWLHLQKIRK